MPWLTSRSLTSTAAASRLSFTAVVCMQVPCADKTPATHREVSRDGNGQTHGSGTAGSRPRPRRAERAAP